jgi:segregation and condensation protein B
MEDITREVPADSTPTPSSDDRGQAFVGKGPEEALRRERGEVADDLVVRDRMTTLGETPMLAPIEVDEPESAVAATDTDNESEAPIVDEVVDASIDADAAEAAVKAEEDTVAIEEDLGGDDEGLPPVPELADAAAVARMVYVLMLTSREGLTIFRLAQACNTTQKLVEESLGVLREQMQQMGIPVELARTGDTVKWMSTSETFPYLQRLRGVKKLERLSPAALETLAVIAYRQPVMRGEIEAIRGVKAGPMLRTLLHHKLVKVTGRADVPGRPLQYGTTQQFLERFGLASLQELPSIKEWKSLG